LCTAYAFTDHKSQGQTIECVIVDISPMRRFVVDPFTVYVTLSRSRGRKTIRLLRDFDKEIFTKHPSEYLHLEDERLEKLAMDMKIKYGAGHYNYL
jgi:ATP-dependent exoDNAse (exonuclease V) alpha subunit